MKKTIVFTGGHHNSALVVAKELKNEGINIIWLGHKFASGGDKSFSAEFKEITANKIKFIELKTGKFYKKNFFEWFKILFGFIQSLYYLIKYHPSLIFSSGGYLSVPVVIAGWLLGIPSITHEQTVVAGWANKAVSPFVKKILLSYESSLPNYPAGKSEVVGLPVRKEILSKKNTKKFTPPLLYITCGKQGSHTINQAVFPLIPKLIKSFTVVHQTGSNTATKDTEKARRIKEKLGDLGGRYQYSPYFFSDEAAVYLRSAKVVVSRSGAHSSYELMILNKNAVLIPIPWVSHNEQFLNAQMVSANTNSLILEEKDLTSDTLYQSIEKLKKATMTKSKNNLPVDAAKKILHVVHRYI